MAGERILALDIGGKRIGVAISDELGMIASPVTMIPRQSDVSREVRTLVDRYGIGRLVVGLPVGLSGRGGPQAEETRAFADALAETLDVPMEYVDERLSTAIAEKALIAQGTRRERRKEHVDAMAAAVFLQGYLDAARYTNAKRRR